MTPRISPAEASELEAVSRLLLAAQLPLDGLTDQFPRGYAVAYREAELVGIAGVEEHGSSGLLRSVAVAPGARGAGIGRELVRDRLGFARQRKLQPVYLLTTTAAPFFEALGFSRVERDEVEGSVVQSVEFATACPASAACLWILV